MNAVVGHTVVEYSAFTNEEIIEARDAMEGDERERTEWHDTSSHPQSSTDIEKPTR